MDELYGKKYVFKGQTLSSLLSPEHAGNLNGKLRYHFEEIDPIKDDAKARILRFIITGVRIRWASVVQELLQCHGHR